MELPADDFILLSFVNTKLRDNYGSLEELCDDLDFSADEIISRLSALGYEYCRDDNVFRRK